MKKRRIAVIISIVLLSVLLLASAGLNIYQYYWSFDSYLQDSGEIYVMEAGILLRNQEFAQGEELELIYDFEHEDYSVLLETCGVEETAGSGTELERALRLMDEYSPRLTHESNYDNHIEMRALPLLEYSLDNPKQGINCRSKAQILNEMCLALGIYSRKVWIMPYSEYDTDCHVVNEVWDTALGKWVMLDITNDEYWVDENGVPLSVLEIRQKGAMNEFCTPVHPGEATDDLHALKEKNIGSFLYIMKNMVYFEYCSEYSVGEITPFYLLAPESIDRQDTQRISQAACERAPM